MFKHLFSFITLILFFSSFPIFSQKTTDASGDEKVAKQFFNFGDYNTALKEYKFLYTMDSNNLNYAFPLAICYLNTHVDKTLAIPLLEKIVETTNANPDAYYHLGLAYHLANRFDEAIDNFKIYQQSIKGEDKNYPPAHRCIEMCENARELMEKPINVSFENMGTKINSSFPDYNPYINRDESTLYFSSKRSGNLGGIIDLDGFLTADIFLAENKYAIWDKAKRLASPINTMISEEIAGLSSDGKNLYIYSTEYGINTKMQSATKNGKSFQTLKPLLIGGNNTPTAIYITPDKKTIFYALQREDGYGDSDIYMSKILPDGNWGSPENLGPEINTSYNEGFPTLSADGSLLYFASEGHNSMGKMDIFVSKRNIADNTFSEAENLGFPVNTTDDNTIISFTQSGRYAYTACFRKDDTYGNLDIYRVIFNDVKPALTILKGTLVGNDSVNLMLAYKKRYQQVADSINALLNPLVNEQNSLDIAKVGELKKSLDQLNTKLATGLAVEVTIVSAQHKNMVGNYRPNKETGKFVALLKPGNYEILVLIDGKQVYNDFIKIEDRETQHIEINKIIRIN